MSQPSGRLAFGAEVLLRYRYRDGGWQAALPLSFAEDTADRLVGWLAEGTEIMYWAIGTGTDPRSVPLQDRFSGVLSTAQRRWEGGGVLRVIPARHSNELATAINSLHGLPK